MRWPRLSLDSSVLLNLSSCSLSRALSLLSSAWKRHEERMLYVVLNAQRSQDFTNKYFSSYTMQRMIRYVCFAYLQPLFLLLVFRFCFLELCIQALADLPQLGSLGFFIDILIGQKG